ncbi:unnamed protein product [Rotaria magnacalcarata]|uniref:Uncharacterized protein n=2 Tax=Rotaria magnacalcarata TaxID=392030 RepID=A0A816PB24_9BILA|nr:unnamed protein product [Rotaria magnacalcarata]
MRSLIKVINYYDESQDFIMFVTRAVRIIDLITSLDITSFQTHNGLQALINRLDVGPFNSFVLGIGNVKVSCTSSYRSISMILYD